MIQKTTGKVSAMLLNALYVNNKLIFSINDASRILGFNHNSVKKLLYKMKKRNLIINIKSGKYIIVPEGVKGEYVGNWHIVAREIANSSEYYISHYSAMEMHNMLTQPLNKVYISSPKRQLPPKKFKDRFQFIYIKHSKIWGIEESWVTNQDKVRVSDIERTIIDCLWQPNYAGGVSEIAKGIWIIKGKINFNRLIKYCNKFNKYVVNKRLGFILQHLGIENNISNQLKNMSNKRYDILDPSLPINVKYKNEWNLIANLNPEEISQIGHT